jgi:hypothetical protein
MQRIPGPSFLQRLEIFFQQTVPILLVIKWISAAITPIFVKLKISSCYEDSVMVPITLLAITYCSEYHLFPR